MANALKNAPSKQESIGLENRPPMTAEELAINQQFDPKKKYMFELAVPIPEREHPVIDMISKKPIQHSQFPPYRNIVFTSQIVWNGERRGIRYYDGCTSIFIDEQPKDRDTIDDLIKQTTRRFFEEGKFGVFGDERQLLLYMNICSWNSESPFRTRTSDAIFVPLNSDKKADLESLKLDQTEIALQYAKDATSTKMRIHANYLGVPIIDYDSGNELTEKEIRAAYRKEALKNPVNFIETYGNKSIEIKYYIDKALEKGIISNTYNINKATWGKSNTEICDISGLRTHDAISERLFEFSQTEQGEEFLIQLKSVIE